MENALEFAGVTKKYPDFTLRDLSFSLPRGCIMGLIGENGAGKTTALKAALDLIPIDGGEIRLLGLDAKSHGPQARRSVGVVFDDLYAYGALRARDLAAILRGVFPSWDDEAYRRFLSRFRLPDKKPIKDYSRGMRMKLSLAAALSHHPELLLLDEATSGLDPVVRSDILDLLLEFVQDEKRAVLFSSHITSDLERVADYVTFLHKGELVFSEQKDALLERYGVLRCGREDFSRIDASLVPLYRENAFSVEALVPDRAVFRRKYPGLTVDPASLEDIMVFYGKELTYEGTSH